MFICVIDMIQVVKDYPAIADLHAMELELASMKFPLMASDNIVGILDRFNCLHHEM